MIQLGLRKGVAEAMNVFQSSRVLGEKILVPAGQLFFCNDLLTRKQFSHLMRLPAEYRPTKVTGLHAHPPGLLFLGVTACLAGWQ